MPTSDAVCPAGISSFFEVCTTGPDGKPLAGPAYIGARGGGFGLTRGIHAKIGAMKATRNRIRVRINSKPSPEARTTIWALNQLLEKSGEILDVMADLTIRVPIGAGYGTSAAGTLASCVAFADALQLHVTFNEVGRLTHVAEVIHRTGLGTASALMEGGFILVEQPGAPGIGRVDRLFFPSEHSIVCGYLGPIPTRDTLTRTGISEKVNPVARRTMRAIEAKPDVLTFLSETRKFSDQVGFQTREIARLMQGALTAGAVGVAQNMVGLAIHAVVENSKIPRVTKALQHISPRAKVFASTLDDRGVRLV